jgi:hypothetical protein
MAQFSDLLGLTLASVERIGDVELHFTSEDGRKFRLYHEQDCCESVTINDICGELEWLIGSPITLAAEVSDGPFEVEDERQTWTYYRLATVKGYVSVRWYGASNGYYSESVDFEEVTA